MNRYGIGVDELEGLCDVVQSPFDRLFGEALALDVPTERAQSFGRDVNVCICLDFFSLMVI